MKSNLPLRVVIFEDEFLLANDLKQQIQKHEYEVIAMFRKAEEGLQFMEKLHETDEIPDVILMDITLAGKMTGIEAAEIICEKYNCALVFLTGMSQLGVFEEAFKTRPHAYLIKPFDINQTIVNIKLAVYQNTLEQQLLKNQGELEQRVMERTRELLEARDQAEEAIRLKNTLLGNISTQIREPLLGLRGMVNLLKAESNDIPNIQRYISYFEDNISHLFSLLQRILELKD